MTRRKHGEMRNAYNILVRKHEGRRPLEGSRRREKDNIKMDLKVIGCRWFQTEEFCDYSNEPSGSAEGSKALNQLATVSV